MDFSSLTGAISSITPSSQTHLWSFILLLLTLAVPAFAAISDVVVQGAEHFRADRDE